MRLRASEMDEAKRLSEMPRFFAWNKLKDVKPGATVLANMSADDSASFPAMIVQSFGSGRVAALTIADLWRWTMRRAQDDSNDLAQCWRQMARWLTADVPKRLKIEIVAPVKANDPHTIKILARDESYLPLDNASFEVSVLPPDGKLVPVDVTPDREHAGLYQANFWSQIDGPYVVSVKAKAADGAEIGEVESGWSAEPSALEFRNLVRRTWMSWLHWPSKAVARLSILMTSIVSCDRYLLDTYPSLKHASNHFGTAAVGWR